MNLAFFLFAGITLFISGLLVNIVQAVLFFTLRYVNLNLYRKINFQLNYTVWSQLVALADWYAGTRLTVYFGDERSKELFGTRHTMYLMNHHYEVDWLISWLIIDRFNLLGNAKSFVKKSLRFIPVFGFAWIFSEFAFLARSYDKDSKNIIQSLRKFIDYQDPISFLFFAEGTRFTEAKHEASVKFAEDKGLPVMKHHLFPRTKGFRLCIQTFKEKCPKTLVASIELKFPENSTPPTFTSLLKKQSLAPDVYIHLVPISEIPSDTDEQMDNYLYKMFQNKDDLIDYYNEKGHFPGIKQELSAGRKSLINWLAWLLLSAVSMVYSFYYLLFNGSLLTIGIILAIIAAGVASVMVMVNSTKIKKASSYGTEATKKAR